MFGMSILLAIADSHNLQGIVIQKRRDGGTEGLAVTRIFVVVSACLLLVEAGASSMLTLTETCGRESWTLQTLES